MRMPSSARLSSLVLALLLVGCGGDGGPSGPRVTAVQVTPAEATLEEVGGTQQFSARPTDGQGQTVSGEAVTWSSDDTEVATVSSTGLATAVGNGVATIRAAAGGVSGTAVLTVFEPAGECIDPETLTLVVGEEAELGSEECFVLPAGQVGDRYRVVVTRPDSAAESSVVTATLSVTGLTPVTQAPGVLGRAPALPSDRVRLDPGTLRELERSLAVASATARRHARLRASEERLLARLGPGALVPDAGPARAPAALQAAPAKIRVDPNTECDGSPREEVTGILVHTSAELAIYQDSAQRSSSPLSQAHARRMADYYAAYGREVVERYFGVPSDIDGNGRMIVFVSPVVGGQTAAQVWSGDFTTRAQCTDSNEGEYIFFSNSLIGRMGQAQPNYQALETLVHEAKHVVSLRNRLIASIRAGNVNRFHPLWVEEGTAEIAGNMSSRVAVASLGKVPVGGRLDIEDLADGDGKLRATPENYGVLLRMLRTVRYLSSQPNGLAVIPDGAHPDHSVYATGWNFHRWLGDAYGNAEVAYADSSLFRALADSTVARGTAGLLEVTGRSFKELFGEFTHAVTVHRTGAPEGTRAFTSYDFVSATDILCRPDEDPADSCTSSTGQPDGLYPWPVTDLSEEPGVSVPATLAAAEYSGPIGPTGIRIHDFVSDGTASAQIEVRMSRPGRILVVRIQ